MGRLIEASARFRRSGLIHLVNEVDPAREQPDDERLYEELRALFAKRQEEANSYERRLNSYERGRWK